MPDPVLMSTGDKCAMTLKNKLLRWHNRLLAEKIDLHNDANQEDLGVALISLGADKLRHGTNGRSLYDHLMGTSALLRSWALPDELVRAGAFHSVYSTDVFRLAAISINERSQIQGLIGTRSELLVYWFCSIDRNTLFEMLESGAMPFGPEDVLPIKGRCAPHELFKLTQHDVLDLLILHAVNMVEQENQSWLAPLSRILRIMKSADQRCGPLDPGLLPPFDSALEGKYRKCYMDHIIRGQCLDESCALGPPDAWCGEIWIWRAFWSACRGDLSLSRKCASVAVERLHTTGLVWDKTLTGEEWRQLAKVFINNTADFEQAIRHSSLISSASLLYELVHHRIEFPSSLPSALSYFTVDTQDIAPSERLTRYMALITDHNRSQEYRVFPDLTKRPFWDPSQFPIVQALEASWATIATEVGALEHSFFHEESERIRRDGSWDVFMLYERGRKHLANCRRCPQITRIIERYNTVRSLSGLIYISRMAPGTYIHPHRGPTNIRLRCHLGIRVPKGNCGVDVSGTRASWAEGKCLVFDDYFEHSAWNYTDESRIVLIVDLWHPALLTSELCFLKGLQRYAYLQAEGLHAYWSANAHKMQQRRDAYD